MRPTLVLLVSLLIPIAASAEPASEASVRQLLEVTGARKLIEGIKDQTESRIRESIRMASQGRTLSVRQQAAVDHYVEGATSIVGAEIAWEKLEPMQIRLYRETFSEDEVNGMIDIYATPTGQALLRKMPTLLNRVMEEMQRITSAMQPKLQKLEQDVIAEMRTPDN